MVTGSGQKREKFHDVTEDLLLCNRCGSCRAVCPVFDIIREEWASARGKIEVAEAFFRGEKVKEKSLRRIFDLCLHCKTCEENCPSGARADEIIMAVRAEMGRRGMIPRLKRAALRVLDGMDRYLFRAARLIGLHERSSVHGTRGRSVLNFLYPLLGWSRQRFVPLPSKRSFIDGNPSIFRASRLEGALPPSPGSNEMEKAGLEPGAAFRLAFQILEARKRNLREGRRALLFLGHTVNNFFPGEAGDMVFALNLLGIDVAVPPDQICCFAPNFYTGDIEGARRGAARLVRILSRYDYDWIVTSCASGGLMLKREYPRLFDIEEDGFFRIGWDSADEVFTREKPEKGTDPYAEERALYVKKIQGRVRDINELVAGFMSFKPPKDDYEGLFLRKEASGDAGDHDEVSEETGQAGTGDRPVVVYHHPCHLNRGQGVSAEPEHILSLLPGYRFVRMEDDDLCCGGGGMFTFTEAESGERIGRKKIEAIAKADPDIVSTSCPVCRIQLMDMLGRDYGAELDMPEKKLRRIPVLTPMELLAEDLRKMTGNRF